MWQSWYESGVASRRRDKHTPLDQTRLKAEKKSDDGSGVARWPAWAIFRFYRHTLPFLIPVSVRYSITLSHLVDDAFAYLSHVAALIPAREIIVKE